MSYGRDETPIESYDLGDGIGTRKILFEREGSGFLRDIHLSSGAQQASVNGIMGPL